MKGKFYFIPAIAIVAMLVSGCSIYRFGDSSLSTSDTDNSTDYSDNSSVGQDSSNDSSTDISISIDSSDNSENSGSYDRLSHPTGNTYHDLGQNSYYSTYYAPCEGDSNILVIPVTIKGYESKATTANKQKIQKAFFGTSEETGWESVKSYFYKSSYGNFNISGDVTDWFEIGLTPKQVYEKNDYRYGDGGTFYVLNKAVEWAKTQGYDMKDYDVDKDGYIDCVWLVYSCPYEVSISGVSSNDNPFWAFTYWDYSNVYVSPNVSNPITNTYAWASIDFMNDGSSSNISIDAHTYIHEHGHVIGLDDYYDYDGLHSPLGRYDMQDCNVGDHNAYSKFAFGWTTPYVVKGDATITINPSSSSGHSIILANPSEADNITHAFNEYLILELLTPNGLWEKDATYSYSGYGKTYSTPGVRMLHVDGRLLNSRNSFVDGVTDSVRHAFSNTPSYSYSSGTRSLRQDLVALIPADKSTKFQTSYSAAGSSSTLFKTGDTFTVSEYSSFFSNQKLHNGITIPYEVIFENVSAESATITFKLIG